MNKKRLLAYLTSLSVLLSTAACNNSNTNNQDNDLEMTTLEEVINSSKPVVTSENSTTFSQTEKPNTSSTTNDNTTNVVTTNGTTLTEGKDNPALVGPPVVEPVEKSITITAVGDCTLGRDDRGSYDYSLPYYLEKNNNDYSYFFKGVYDILSQDDLTIANLETTFTDSTKRADKQFTFKGPSDYTNILTSGSVEAVNLANNHTKDYLQKGYDDTLAALENSPVKYFGNGIYSIMEIKGVRIGMCGIQGWGSSSACKDIDEAMEYFKANQTDLEIFSFHWGVERDYKQNDTQEKIARYAVDSGADLVLGHHPHVLQGVEYYNGVYIVYSLANFVFGGNKNPSDKDTMVFQITFDYEDEKLVGTTPRIIPTSVSSTTKRNDYQPTVLDGDERERVLKKILKSSTNFNYNE